MNQETTQTESGDAPITPFETKKSTLIPLGQLIKESWAEYKKRPLHYSAAAIGAFALIAVVEFLLYAIFPDTLGDFTGAGNAGGVQNILAEIIRQAASVWFMAGLMIVFLGQLIHGKSSLTDLLYSPKHVTMFLIIALIQLATMTGLIFLIIPGIILYIRYMFADYVFFEKGTGIIESFQKSVALTKGNGLRLFGYLIVMMLIGVSGIIALGIGLAVTLPVSFLMHMNLYRSLQKNPSEEESEPSWIIRNVKPILIVCTIIGLGLTVLGSYFPDEPFEWELEEAQELDVDESLPLETVA